MEKLVNENVVQLINSGQLSGVKLTQLIALKEFIDRLAQNNYVSEDVVSDMVSKYGVKPGIVTWGDYFQTELAYDSVDYTDEEFLRVITTVKFDIMSSYEIFSTQGYEFFDWIEDNFKTIIEKENVDYTEEEQEVLHLKILKDYYINMNLENKFTEDEVSWYSSFAGDSSEAVAQ